jgi:hypothetical protein
MPAGCALEGNAITCSLGDLEPKNFGGGAITLVPDAPGLLTCTASASSATADPMQTNQSKTVDTQVS